VKIQELLHKNHILIDLKVKDKLDLITQMGAYLASSCDLDDVDLIINKILERESEMSTGVGFGIAIPHGRIDAISHPHMLACRCKDPVDYNSIDDQPVQLVFMMISPTNTANEHSQILSSLSKIMIVPETRQALLDASTADEFLSVMIDGENALG